jgi:hypothetical protein
VKGVRKIVVYELLSLDGVAEDPDTFFADWDEAMDANLAAVIATQDAVILGRRSYTEWAQFWPSSQIQPFATFINGVTKYVATSTPLDRDWTTPRRLAVDSARIDPKRDLTDWLSARRLSRRSLSATSRRHATAAQQRSRRRRRAPDFGGPVGA